jgi:hypothetical protein
MGRRLGNVSIPKRFLEIILDRDVSTLSDKTNFLICFPLNQGQMHLHYMTLGKCIC